MKQFEKKLRLLYLVAMWNKKHLKKIPIINNVKMSYVHG